MTSLRAFIRARRARPGVASTSVDRGADHRRMRIPGSLSGVPGVQRRSAGQARGAEATDSRLSHAELSHGGRPLDPPRRAFFEARLGRDLSQVRIHSGGHSREMNRALSSRAFTYRNHIWLGRPENAVSGHTLAHELAHVVQQTRPARSSGPPPAASGSAAGVSVSAAPPAIQRQLKPPGNCIRGVHDAMQRNVKKWCDHPSGRHCSGSESCTRLRQKIKRNQMCAQSRKMINDICYAGGDVGHRIAETDARLAQATCMASFVAKKCGKKRRKNKRKTRRRVSKSWLDKMAAITGLTGAALIAYLIVSEGSRIVFPPRNLIPVP
ncbi:MAG: DUF4157 domain-containing protein [Pseudomonadota bacterium]